MEVMEDMDAIVIGGSTYKGLVRNLKDDLICAKCCKERPTRPVLHTEYDGCYRNVYKCTCGNVIMVSVTGEVD